MNPVLYKQEIIAIAVPNGTTQKQFMFPDNALIRNSPQQLVKTKGIEFFPVEAGTTLAPDGTTVMSSADLCKGYLYLYMEAPGVGDGLYFNIPIVKLITVHNNDVTLAGVRNYPHVDNPSMFADLKVNWPKSYVAFPGALAATNVSILCVVSYDFQKLN